MRSQYISHELIINGLLSSLDISVLAYINTRPQYCLENLETIAKAIHRSKRTIQRSLERLVGKGIIKRRYTTFKRLVLTIVSLDEQKEITKTGGVLNMLKYCAFKNRKRDAMIQATEMSQLKATEMSHPISRSNKIKSIYKSNVNFEENKRNQILKYKEFLQNMI